MHATWSRGLLALVGSSLLSLILPSVAVGEDGPYQGLTDGYRSYDYEVEDSHKMDALASAAQSGVQRESRAEAARRAIRLAIRGRWTVQSSQRNGRDGPNETVIETVEIRDSEMRLIDQGGVARILEYTLKKSGDGILIDLYHKRGQIKGPRYPSRLEMNNGTLRILLPVNRRARLRRPGSLDTATNPDWILLSMGRWVSAIL